MKQIKLLAALGLSAVICAACTSNPSGAQQGEATADSTVVDSLKTDTTAEAPYVLDFGLKNLLVLMKSYEDFEGAEASGLNFLYEDGSQDEEVESIIYVYGRGVEKGKKEVFGYQIKATSPHAIYFTYSLDTSQQANLYFANEADARQFIENVLKQESTDYQDRTYYVHPVEREDAQYLYIDEKYEEDQYSTAFVIYPPRMEELFCRVEIEVYV